jgi:hypothetical protein
LLVDKLESLSVGTLIKKPSNTELLLLVEFNEPQRHRGR